MIEVKNLYKSYGPVKAVDGISFNVKKGEVVGLLGPNGAGKSTAMRCLTCYYTPDSGEATVGGYDIYKQSLEVRSVLGYLPESAPLYLDMNVLDYLDFIGDIRGMGTTKQARRDEMVEVCGLKGVVFKDINELSKGYRQRVGLAAAMIHDPDYLVLDEPTTGLDPNQIVEIRNLIKDIGHRRDKCVILSTHILPEVEVTCDRAIIIHQGKIIAEGTTTELTGFARGADIYIVTFLGNKNKIESVLTTMPDIASFSLEEEHQNKSYKYNLTAKSVDDISEKIFDMAVANEFKLIGLNRETARLEDIFRTLTTKEVA
jgi:ABC-2 type transport system ATP-binding protein